MNASDPVRVNGTAGITVPSLAVTAGGGMLVEDDIDLDEPRFRKQSREGPARPIEAKMRRYGISALRSAWRNAMRLQLWPWL